VLAEIEDDNGRGLSGWSALIASLPAVAATKNSTMKVVIMWILQHTVLADVLFCGSSASSQVGKLVLPTSVFD
jgi:hypothetical protein